MKLKLDDKGNVVLQDGKPVYVRDDGTDFIADVPDLYNKVVVNKQEVDKLRTERDKAVDSLKVFDGIDVSKARTAIETVAALDQGKLADAEKLRKEVTEAVTSNFTKQIEEKDKTIGELTTSLNREAIGGRFSRSGVIGEKPGNLLLPADIAEATFGRHFKLEDGKVVAYDNSGNKIYSEKTAGELADFDEALSILVKNHPHRDKIVAGSNHNGSGGGGGGGGTNGKKAYRREEFIKLPYDKQQEVSSEVSAGKAELID